MNEHFSLFLEEFGQGQSQEPADEDFFREYEGVLPPSYLSFVKAQGFASYAGGLLWTVHPSRLSRYAQVWLDAFETLAGKRYWVFARSAFGDLYAIQSGSGHQISISTATGVVWAPRKILAPSKRFELGIESFFGSAYPKDFDIEDDKGHSLFKYAIDTLGGLGSNEMYGFVPALSAGGRISAESLSLVALDVHLDMLVQLASPSLRMV